MIVPILKVYEKYKVPIILREHMLRATSLAKLICERWAGPSISQEDTITVMLIHDIGNIAKMDFSNFKFHLGEKADLDYWQNIKEKFIRKYGSDDHIATFNVAYEIGLNVRLLWLLANKIFIHNEMISNSSYYELKICAYADQRAGPFGIVSLKERFDELRRRYGDKAGASINHPRIHYLIASAHEIEKQILEYADLEPSQSLTAKIDEIMPNLLMYEINTTKEL